MYLREHSPSWTYLFDSNKIKEIAKTSVYLDIQTISEVLISHVDISIVNSNHPYKLGETKITEHLTLLNLVSDIYRNWFGIARTPCGQV